MQPGGINVSNNIQWKQSRHTILMRSFSIIFLIMVIIATIIIYQEGQNFYLGFILIILALVMIWVFYKIEYFYLKIDWGYDEACQLVDKYVNSNYNEVKVAEFYTSWNQINITRRYYILDIQTSLWIVFKKGKRVAIHTENWVTIQDKQLYYKLIEDILELFEK